MFKNFKTWSVMAFVETLVLAGLDHPFIAFGLGLIMIMIGIIVDNRMKAEPRRKGVIVKPKKTQEAIEHEKWLAYNTYFKK